jgi:hypothetical protein
VVVLATCGGGTSPTGADGAAGQGGSGGTAAPVSYSCGSDTCTSDQTFCYSYAAGIAGGGTSRGCRNLPTECAKKPTCACVCPPIDPSRSECAFTAGWGGFCYCSETNGELTVSCAGQ